MRWRAGSRTEVLITPRADACCQREPNGIDCGQRPPPLHCINEQSIALRSARTEVRIGFAIAYSDPSFFVRRLPDFGGQERDYPCQRRALRKVAFGWNNCAGEHVLRGIAEPCPIFALPER